VARIRLPGRAPKSPPPPTTPIKEEIEELPPEEDGEGARMGFFEHLDELRQRITRAAIALVVGSIVGIAVAQPALEYLVQPYCNAVKDNVIQTDEGSGGAVITDSDCRLVSLGPTGGVVAYFRVALTIGGIIAVPTITYQLLMFIFPGLTRKEKRIVLLSLPAVMFLFLIGVAFAWFILMPPALGFLEGFQATLFKPEWTADLYLSFITSLIFWMGVAFETPLVFFVLGLIGVVSVGPLIRNWRIAVVGAAIAAALITPTIDPVNMFLVMGPLMALYALSIILVYIARRIARIEDTPVG
jgi:sec-independent protein translocase protein TatC